MNEKISDLNTKFWDDFPSLYKKNRGTNSYLYKTSNEIEKTITKMFKNYGLEEEYSIFAIGGFGKKEMFPSSDIDISSIVFSTVCSKSFKISLVSSIVFFRDFFKSSTRFSLLDSSYLDD